MWPPITTWRVFSSPCFRTVTNILISTKSRQLRRLAQSHSSVARTRCIGNVGSYTWPTDAMSKLSPNTSLGALALSTFETSTDDDDTSDQSSRFKLIGGLLSANIGVYSAFSLSDALRTHWKPASRLHHFMRNNFILSLERIRLGRWHVFLTYCCSHLDMSHLLRNCLFSFALVFEPASVTIPLFISGSLFSGLVAVLMVKRMGKTNMAIVGSSGALYATVSYSVLNRDWKHVPALLPHALIIGATCLSAWFAVSAWRGTSLSPTITISHFGHLAGLILGVTTYYLLRLSTWIRSKGVSQFNRKKHDEYDEP